MKAFREHRARPTVITSWKLRWFVLNVRTAAARSGDGAAGANGGTSSAEVVDWPCAGQATTHSLYYFKQPSDDEARDADHLEGCHMQLFTENSEGGGAGGIGARVNDGEGAWGAHPTRGPK